MRYRLVKCSHELSKSLTRPITNPNTVYIQPKRDRILSTLLLGINTYRTSTDCPEADNFLTSLVPLLWEKLNENLRKLHTPILKNGFKFLTVCHGKHMQSNGIKLNSPTLLTKMENRNSGKSLLCAVKKIAFPEFPFTCFSCICNVLESLHYACTLGIRITYWPESVSKGAERHGM
jgi:hypothetical protein